MNDAERTILDPDAPTPTPHGPPADPAYLAEPAHPRARPDFRDRVLGMRAVIAVALASLVLGGTGGAILGASTGGGNDGFGGPGPGGPGGLQRRGNVPGQGQQFPVLPNGAAGPGHDDAAQ